MPAGMLRRNRDFDGLLGKSPQRNSANRQFGFVFQFYHLLPELNVLENTMLAPMIEFSWLGFKSKAGRVAADGPANC